MTAKQSPFFSINYGWDFGENGWNTGMDDNLKRISFLLNKSVISFITSLPLDPVEGDAYILMSTGAIFVFMGGEWLSITPEEGVKVYVQESSLEVSFKNGIWVEETTTVSGIRVAYIGDSLTQNSTRNMSWANQTTLFLEQLTGASVYARNLAIGGSTFNDVINTPQHSNQTKTQVEEAIEFSPDLVFVALGINDSVFAATATPEQVISSAGTLVNTIKAQLPDCKVIYVEEVPHDITTVGLNPTTLRNQDAVPFSHTLISLKGRSNVRIMDSSYLNTTITGSALTKHKNWATATLGVRSLFDGYFQADLWKMARMGCVIDGIHIDELGHCLWAWSAISYLADSGLTIPGIDLTKLKFTNITAPLFSIDALWTITKTFDYNSNMPLQYRGENMYERTSNWALRYPRARMDYSVSIQNGNAPLPINIVNVAPNAPVWYAWDSENFLNISRNTTRQGNHLQTVIPSAASPISQAAGAHTIWYAIQNPDGSHDAFVGNVVLNNALPPSLAASIGALKYNPSATVPTNGSIAVINFNSVSYDGVSVGTNAARFTIPASINGRKFKLCAGLRMTLPVNATNGRADVFVGFRKNGQAVSGNTDAAGRGMAAARQSVTNVSGAVDTLSFDLNLTSADMIASTGDYYELIIVCLAPTATSSPTLVQNVYSFMELKTT